jgi:Na+/H+-dicarboxylate symporter
MSLATKVLIGMGLGICAGIFFGEQVAFLKIVGDAFVQLLQMTVLPYVMTSLIVGLGGLSYQQAAALARKCGVVLLLLWGIGLAMVLVMPLAFPDWQSASLFSTSLIEQTSPFDFLSLYIPSNLFHSLTNNTVPAVVVFSVVMGVALIGMKDNATFLKSLSAVVDALGRMTGFVVQLAPFGVFAIIATATGVMRLPELQRLNVYMLTYAVASLLLTFWILPGLVTCLTALRYKNLVGATRDALITAFATGNIFIVLPLLAERSKALLKPSDGAPHETDANVDVIISTSFSFPNLGKILTLGFVLFAGWFSDSVVPVTTYVTFAVSGLFSFFGDPTIAIPFLLDMLRIPSDTFRYFLVVDNLVGARFGTLLAAMSTLVLAVLGASAVSGLLMVRWRRLLLHAAISSILTICSIGGIRLFFEKIVGQEYKEDRAFTSLRMAGKYPAAIVYRSSLPAVPAHNPEKSRVSEVCQRGFLRVGYFNDAMPFAFDNNAGELVGLDVEMAHQLAQALDVKLEFVMIERGHSGAMLNGGYVDVVMSGLHIMLERTGEITYSNPHLSETLAFIVKDHRREEFSTRDKVRRLVSPRIGMPNSPYYLSRMRQYLPQAKVVLIASPAEYFGPKGASLDAMLYTAEAGSVWTLIHPAYSVVIPRPDIVALPLAYAVAHGEREFATYLNTWIDLKQKDRTIQGLYDYWILGRNVANREPRWSVIRNLLHWVD